MLCLPSDIFASRRTGPVLQQLESSFSWDYSASDAFKAVSKYWDRINRPDQLPTALLEAMRTLTSPADTGAVTISPAPGRPGRGLGLPDRPLPRAHLARRPGPRRPCAPSAGPRRSSARAKRPVIIAGGGVIYSAATEELAAFAPRPASRSA